MKKTTSLIALAGVLALAGCKDQAPSSPDTASQPAASKTAEGKCGASAAGASAASKSTEGKCGAASNAASGTKAAEGTCGSAK